ncbi:hypothetical protein RvY_04392 [Ramazzottius varieornatus]|uniref:RNA helicase n=1 Tax=Ramazzottius varieornatus TaxID=947166 RepID=A0A1D1UX75_RAMVA|nr:hypothetical protein RvY_04392 [Ramazzottius varieornatus]
MADSWGSTTEVSSSSAAGWGEASSTTTTTTMTTNGDAWSAGGWGETTSAGSGWGATENASIVADPTGWGGTGFNGSGGGGGFAGNRLKQVDWNAHTLIPFQKDFYVEAPSVAGRSLTDVAEFYAKNQITIKGENCPKPVITFAEAGFPEIVYRAIQESGYAALTAIQSIEWPIALKGRNMVGIARTGSGKTISFLLPAMVHLKAQPPVVKGDGPAILVLAPTRELALQCHEVAKQFGEYAGLRCTCVYGGAPKYPQVAELEKGVAICIATPGRLLDLLESNRTSLRRCTYAVLDEADRMLDMGFEPQIRKIMEQIRPDRHGLMWSATWLMEIRRLAEEFLKGYVHATIGSLNLCANTKITQRVAVISEYDKMNKLE